MIRMTRLTRLTITPRMDRATRLPSAIGLEILTIRDRRTSTISNDRPTRMKRLTWPAKIPRLNWQADYTDLNVLAP